MTPWHDAVVLWCCGAGGSDWRTVNFGKPVFKRPGPREASLRQTTAAGASLAIGPLPPGTKRLALYLPTSPSGAGYVVTS